MTPWFPHSKRAGESGGGCIDIITPDLTENAEYVNEAWRTVSQSRLAGIFETGRRLIEIRDRYIDPATGMARAKADEGKCSRLIGDNQWSGQSLLLFEATHTKRLIRIAESELLRPHGAVLPSDTFTLDELRALNTHKFRRLSGRHRIQWVRTACRNMTMKTSLGVSR